MLKFWARSGINWERWCQRPQPSAPCPSLPSLHLTKCPLLTLMMRGVEAHSWGWLPLLFSVRVQVVWQAPCIIPRSRKLQQPPRTNGKEEASRAFTFLLSRTQEHSQGPSIANWLGEKQPRKICSLLVRMDTTKPSVHFCHVLHSTVPSSMPWLFYSL